MSNDLKKLQEEINQLLEEKDILDIPNWSIKLERVTYNYSRNFWYKSIHIKFSFPTQSYILLFSFPIQNEEVSSKKYIVAGWKKCYIKPYEKAR